MLENDNNQIDPNAPVGDFSPRPLSEFLLGPENPDEGDHQSKLDNLDTSRGEPDPNMFGDHAQPYTPRNDRTISVEGTVTGETISSIDAFEKEHPDLTAHNKRVRQQAKLRGLGQEALDRIWDEHEFNTDPRFAEINEAIKKDPDNLSDGEVKATFDLLAGSGAMIEFITKLLKLPAEREAAVNRYTEYRSMLEDFG